MRREVKIKLDSPIVSHQGPIAEAVIREPNYAQFMQFGDPFVVARSDSGVPFVMEDRDVVQKYLEACVVQPDDPVLLSQISARNARQIKEALLDFFNGAAPEAAA